MDAPIGRQPSDRKKMAVDWPNGRPAVTHWRGAGAVSRLSPTCECRLETGRTHQIRVHMAYIGHPLLGDTVYGSKKPVPGLAGQCLHARRLRFTHPCHWTACGAGVSPPRLVPGCAGPALRLN